MFAVLLVYYDKNINTFTLQRQLFIYVLHTNKVSNTFLLKFKAVLCNDLLRTTDFFGYMLLVFVNKAYIVFQMKLTVPNKKYVEFSYHQIKKSKQSRSRKHVN
jgi:hypothetical protein